MTPSAELGPDHLPLVDAAPVEPLADMKPRWRGWIHAVTFPLAIALGIILISLADGGAAKAACAVFTATSLLLFGVSATYHRIDWSPRVKAIFRRLDHSNIFLLIAGTYTPIAVCALPFPKSAILLAVVWTGAILGVVFRIFWLGASRWVYVPLYIALGWAAMFYIVDLLNANVATMVLILIGGLTYTLGAVFYALKRPNPVPGVFGFHEMFHTCTVIAFACQWTGILLIAMHPISG